MVTNISQINSTNYDSEELNNSYHSDIYKYRMNDKNFNKSTRLRDEYFNKVENFNTNYDFNDFKNNELENIRQNMDISSLEYSQVLNVDKLISRLEESPKIDLSDYKISLTNSEFEKDGSIKLQLHSGSEQYVINSSNTDDLINIKEGNLKNYNYDEEQAISNKLNENQFNKDIDKDISKLKSMELEKNVINTIPKEEQNNEFKETLSRLDKNQSQVKQYLNKYLNENKINEYIDSVKKHFEGIKIKAEDIQKNFKDLGSWNTDNKFVKNIDNVIEKVKELSHKNENKIDLNDENSLTQIEQKIKKSNEFIDNVSTQNNKENQLRDNKINFLQQTLEIKNPELLKESNSIEDSIKDLSKSEKITLYNNVKDISSLNNNKFVSEDNQLNTIIKAEKLSKAIEKDIGTNEINQFRKDYLTSSTKKPAELELENNEQLKMYSNQANNMIKNASRDDLKNYQTNANNEINSINNNQKANSLKNNELIKKFNMNNQLTNNEQQSNNMEKEHDQLEKRKKNNVQLR